MTENLKLPLLDYLDSHQLDYLKIRFLLAVSTD